MRFMNQWAITDAVRLYEDHPVLGPATRTLENLADWANANSDGWCYWPAPCKAAAKLQELIQRDGTWQYAQGGERPDATVAEYRKALAPVKAFRTRRGADFTIVAV